MEKVGNIASNKINNLSRSLQGNNVNVDSNIVNNVYDDHVAFRIKEATDIIGDGSQISTLLIK
ncbi:MAG: hypothetical protein MUO21_03460 [Nitrososphaeraceae archaeon]|nr:hypothetical protein [Nitrososphaeraceae archaeon]